MATNMFEMVNRIFDTLKDSIKITTASKAVGAVGPVIAPAAFISGDVIGTPFLITDASRSVGC